jgi:hypothetical protein
MALSLRFLTLFALLGAAASHASAQDRVKEAIFEDCDRAKQEFATLDEPSRTPLFEYLSRVVALNAQAPDAPEAFVMLPGPPKTSDVMVPGAPKGPDLSTGGLWQTVDAKRELKAKRCALELLSLAGKAALAALPSLATVYYEQSLSDEIAVTLEETIADIAERSHNAGLSPSDAELDALIPHVVGEKPLVAHNILTEYFVIALPRILIYFSSASEPAQRSILQFLRDADPDGSRAMRSFIELAPKLPKSAAVSMARSLPFPSREALKALSKDFASLAVGIETSEIFLPLLGRACISLGQLSSEAANILAPSTSLVSNEAIDLDHLKCLVASSAPMAHAVPALVLSGEPSKVDRGMKLLSSALPHLGQDVRHSLFSHLRGIASRPDPSQEQAVPLLALFQERKGEAVATYVQLLSETAKSSSNGALLSHLVITTLAGIEIPKERNHSKLYAVIDAALRNEQDIDAALQVASKIEYPASSALAFVVGDTPEVSRKILQYMTTAGLADKKVLPQLVGLLQFPELFGELRPLLMSYKGMLIPIVRKSLPKLSGNSRLLALSLLEASDSATKNELAELLGFFMNGTCDPFALSPESAVRLLGRHDLSPAQQTTLENRLRLCSSKIPIPSLETLLRGARLRTIPSKGQLGGELEAGLISSERIILLLEHSGNDATPSDSRELLLEWCLSKGDSAMRTAALRNVRDSDAPGVLAPLRALAADASISSDIQTSARLTLARLGDTEFDWRDFVKTTIERAGDGNDVTSNLQVVRLLPPQAVLAEVSSALESSSADEVAGACQVGAALGQQAIPIVSKIWHLREKRTPSIRYAAVLALLEINPLTPDLQEHLRLILVNRYFNHALSRPIQWRQTVAVVDLDKGAFGTLRTVHLERLLSSDTK